MKVPPSSPPSVPRPFSATTRRAAPDPSAACSRLKRLLCSDVIPDATRATPSPRPPGFRPTRRTQPHAATHKTARRHRSLSPTHSPAQAQLPPPRADPQPQQPQSRSQTSPHGYTTCFIHTRAHADTIPPQNLTDTASHRRSPTHAVTQAPYKQSRTHTTPHRHRITQSLGDPETHSQLAAIHSSQPDPHTP